MFGSRFSKMDAYLRCALNKVEHKAKKLTIQILNRSKVFCLQVSCLTLFCLSSSTAQSQNFALESSVIEKETGAPIPYASVYTLRDRRGTITDIDGNFELNNLEASDTIVFYFAGFEKRFLPISAIGPTVELSPLEQLLNDVVVMADASVVYKLIENTGKNVARNNEIAQTYMEMQSFQDDQQLEYFQGYYNGQFDGYEIDDLMLKTARFGVQKTQTMAFLSQETSKAMYKQDFFANNDLFPDTPFGLRRRKLVKKFDLTMNAKYREQNGDITYVVSFTPKKDTLTAFSGRAWIDSATNILTKVEFSIDNASKFPFSPIHKGGSLEQANLHITKTYDRTEKGVRLRSMDFDYDFVFDPKGFYDLDSFYVYKVKPKDSTRRFQPLPTYHIRAEAVLAAYNYDDAFFIPKFTFADPEFADYRKMIAYEDYQEFWNCYKTFRVGRSEEKEAFLDDPRTVTHTGLYKKSHISDIGMYEFPYRHWSKKRVYLREKTDSTVQNGPRNPGDAFEGNSINANKYHLEAQIFFEIDSLCDSLRYRTKTIFDPFQSYYNFERTPSSVAFINVYFDLMEIYRRQLVTKLEAVTPSTKAWTRIYNEHSEEVQGKMRAFIKEVDRGTHEENFQKWNALVKEELNIDNDALFSVPEE